MDKEFSGIFQSPEWGQIIRQNLKPQYQAHEF